MKCLFEARSLPESLFNTIKAHLIRSIYFATKLIKFVMVKLKMD